MYWSDGTKMLWFGASPERSGALLGMLVSAAIFAVLLEGVMYFRENWS